VTFVGRESLAAVGLDDSRAKWERLDLGGILAVSPGFPRAF
jgi:hypothetical protein